MSYFAGRPQPKGPQLNPTRSATTINSTNVGNITVPQQQLKPNQPLGPPAAPVATNVQEFVIRVPKNLKKNHHVMRFNATLNVDFAQWKSVKLERENNLKEFRGMDEDTPKFGAGSEYNKDLREEVRRKKYGIIAKRYKPEAQPWILKVGGKLGKKFRGVREGGVGENAAFYVFTHAPDGAIEAYPLNEWYNFQPIQRYKALSAEEAELVFGRRKKIMNYFHLMMQKRMKGDDDKNEEPEENSKKAKGKKDLKISDMDDWIDSEESSSSEDEDKPKEKKEDGDSDAEKKKNKKKIPEKKKKRDVDDEAFEESDDGDEEGRELDYISDSSEDEPDPESKANKEMKSVAEEDALRKLLTSDEDSDEENKSGDDDKNKEEENANNKKKEIKDGFKDAAETKDKRKKKLKKNTKNDIDSSSGTSGTDSSDSDTPDDKMKNKKSNPNVTNNIQTKRSTSPSASSNSDNTNKRKHPSSMPTDLGSTTSSSTNNYNDGKPDTGHKTTNSTVHLSASSSSSSTPSPSSGVSITKRPKLDTIPFSGVSNSSNKDDYGITEEAVRRYLMRKPMTTTELLTKFKNKKTGVSSEKLVDTMTQILKKINPVKQTIQGKMYLSIKIK